MSDAPESYPYRCLPLGIANSHGWEILNPVGFEAEWNGGLAPDDVVIRPDDGGKPHDIPEALFGQGTVTIHVQGLIQTPPGWNLFVSGPPNGFKDGAAPLTGIIETDWSPYSFTMNWRLTRPNYPVRFEENEVIAHIFPLERGVIEQFEPQFAPIDEAPELKDMFEAWSRSRDEFQRQMRERSPEKPADKWQKLYYRGLTPHGQCPVPDHQTKLQLREFARTELTGQAPAAMAKPVTAGSAAPSMMEDTLGPPGGMVAKYEWLLDTIEKQRALSPAANGIYHCEKLTSDEFLEQFYAPGRPVVIAGEIGEWAAYQHWSAAYLREKLRGRIVEYQGQRTSSRDYERSKDDHKRQAPFDQFIDMIEEQGGNAAYLTAYNSATNAEALGPLQADVGRLEKFLAQSADELGGMMWIGPKATFTPLHHDLTNNLLVQVVGRKRIVLAAAGELPKLYNDRHVFSRVSDVTSADLDVASFPRLQDVCFQEIILNPGEALFIPIGWWHQVESLDFSVSITYTNFKWKNDFYNTYPAQEKEALG